MLYTYAPSCFFAAYRIYCSKVKKTKKIGGEDHGGCKNFQQGADHHPQKLRLKSGDKIVIQEENGRFYFDNAALVAFARVEREFEGAAEEAGFASEADMQKYMKGIREEIRGY